MTKLGVSISLIVIILFGVVGFLIYKSQINPYRQPLITNFEECAKAGNTIMESYPAQCRTASGEVFVQVITNPDTPPDTTPGRIAAGYVAGHITIGPNCPVERIDQPCPTPPQAYSSRKVIVYDADGITIKEKSNIDSSGNYKITLAPGDYFIQITPAGIGPGEKKSAVVKSFQTTTINFDIDTGIR